MSERHEERGGRSARADRLPGRRSASQGDLTTQPVVPPQLAPQHDALPTAPAPAVPTPRTSPAPSGAGIPARAEWTEARRGRWMANLLLTVLVLGTFASLGMTIATRSPMWVIGLVLCAFVAVVVRGTMISSTRSVVRLEGSNLTIQRGSHVDLFNLADTFHLVETVGTPGESRWRLRLETPAGRIIEVGPHQVDAEVIHNAVIYYRTRSESPRGTTGPNWWMFRD